MFDSSIDLSKLYRECIACPKVKQKRCWFPHVTDWAIVRILYHALKSGKYSLWFIHVDLTFGSFETTFDYDKL